MIHPSASMCWLFSSLRSPALTSELHPHERWVQTLARGRCPTSTVPAPRPSFCLQWLGAENNPLGPFVIWIPLIPLELRGLRVPFVPSIVVGKLSGSGSAPAQPLQSPVCFYKLLLPAPPCHLGRAQVSLWANPLIQMHQEAWVFHSQTLR